jgi:peptidylprolyl isomerase
MKSTVTPLSRARFVRMLPVLGIAAWLIRPAKAPAQAEDTTMPRMVIVLDAGEVVIALRPDKAPLHVARIRELANSGFYDGLTVIRVAPGHVVQAGDPKFDGTGGSGQTIKAEITDLKHIRGAVGMARDADPDSGDSQFYICLADRPHLDGHYTVFGQVVSGMELLDRMTPGDGPHGFITERSQQPRIVSVRVTD